VYKHYVCLLILTGMLPVKTLCKNSNIRWVEKFFLGEINLPGTQQLHYLGLVHGPNIHAAFKMSITNTCYQQVFDYLSTATEWSSDTRSVDGLVYVWMDIVWCDKWKKWLNLSDYKFGTYGTLRNLDMGLDWFGVWKVRITITLIESVQFSIISTVYQC